MSVSDVRCTAELFFLGLFHLLFLSSMWYPCISTNTPWTFRVKTGIFLLLVQSFFPLLLLSIFREYWIQDQIRLRCLFFSPAPTSPAENSIMWCCVTWIWGGRTFPRTWGRYRCERKLPQLHTPWRLSSVVGFYWVSLPLAPARPRLSQSMRKQ